MSTENFKNKSFKHNELSKCPFTGAGTPAKFSAGRGQTNRDFWPNSLNLKILSQHSNLSNPMDKKFNYSKFNNLKISNILNDLNNLRSDYFKVPQINETHVLNYFLSELKSSIKI